MKNFFLFLKWRYSDIRFHIKRKWQRFFRGYADSDMWELHSTLSDYLYRMMDGFVKSKRMSYYPVEFDEGFIRCYDKEYDEECEKKRVEEWELVLRKIRDGFKAAKDISEDNCPVEYPDAGKIELEWFKNFELEPEEHRIKVREWMETQEVWRKERMKVFEEGMDLFKKYFFALWD